MKKPIIKITSTVLMLSLMSTALNAATSFIRDEEREAAASKIQVFYWDKKLRSLADELSTEAQEMGKRTAGNLALIAEEMQKNIDSLNNSNRFTSTAMLMGILLSNLEGLDTAPLLQKYQAYLERQIANGSSIQKQQASLMKVIIKNKKSNKEAELNEMRELLQETMNSPYPVFRLYAYHLLFDAAKDSGDKEAALHYLYKGMLSSKRNHARIYEELADFDNSEDYKPKKERYLKKIIKIGTPKEKAEALTKLIVLYANQNSAFYRPSDALKHYQDLISDPQLVRFLGTDNDIHIRIACLFAFSPDETVKNVEKAIETLDDILSKEPNHWNYSYATSSLISIYVSKDPARALRLALEARENPNLPEPFKTYIERSLADLYRDGPEGIKDPQAALQILENLAAMTFGPVFASDYHSNVLLSLTHLLVYGDATVKNAARAIQIHEEHRENEALKSRRLADLAYIYNYDAVHKSPVKLAECYLELIEFYADQPLEKLKVLVNLLNLYDTEGETFNPEEANSIVRRILEIQSGDSVEALEALQSWGQLLTQGTIVVKNIERTIQFYERVRRQSEFKLSSLQKLSYIYEHDSVHKNPVKLAECYLELIEFYADQPLEKLKVLVNLLNLYDTEGETFNPEEANSIVRRILEIQSGDSVESLEALRGLIQLLADGTIAVRSVERNIQLYEGLLENSEFRALSLKKLSNIYTTDPVHRNRSRALEYYLELVELYADQQIEQLKVLENLLGLYETEGDDDQEKTKSIIENILGMQSRNSVEYLETLQRLVHSLMYGNAKIRDIGKAIQILEELCTHTNFKILNLKKLSSIYEYYPIHRNLSKALECQLELVELYADQPVEQLKVLVNLLNLYDTEGETFNQIEADNIVQKIIQMQTGDSVEALEALQSWGQLLTQSTIVVKNTERTIQFYERVRRQSEFKLSSLQKLSYIYEHDSVHKNPVKLAECYLELIELYADRRLEQLDILARLLKLYIAEGMTFNTEETKANAHRILTDLPAEPAPLLNVKIALSNLYYLYPDLSTPEDITSINTEILSRSSELEANSSDLINAHKSLIENYHRQGNVEEEKTTYLRLFNSCENISILTECYQQLIILYADQPLEQLNVLARLLKRYITGETTFNTEEEKARAQEILTGLSTDQNVLAADPTASLKVQIALSDLYYLHPDLSTIEEITSINTEISRCEELERGSAEVINAHQRLINIYKAQQDFVAVRKTYISLLKRSRGDNQASALAEYNTFIRENLTLKSTLTTSTEQNLVS